MLNNLDEFDTIMAAKWLLGKKLIHELNGKKLSGVIVETEAYLANDLASHSFKGLNRRNAAMFGPAGRLYIYLIYGMYYCLNVVTRPEGIGEAVLIRALEPVDGIETMKKNRTISDIYNLCNGPAKLTQALQIGLDFNHHQLNKGPIYLEPGIKLKASNIVSSTRVGISKAKNKKLRFYIKNNQFVSLK